MSNYSDNYDRDYRNERESRTKINNLTWSNVGNSSGGKSKLWCTLCRVRLIPSPKPNEKDKLWCKECGHSFDYEVQTTKPLSKPGSPSSTNSNSFMISQKHKVKVRRIDSVNNDLSDEDLNDLRNMGFRV